jgi:hypothetical protein
MLYTKLLLFLPGLKVWLDVDKLQDISKLEELVAESVVFILYYSRGYFWSKNCQHEIYAAVKLNKPIILLYEGDEVVLQEMENECLSNCDSDNGEKNCPGAESVIPITTNSNNQQYTKQVQGVLEPETNHVSDTISLLVVQGKYEMIPQTDRVLSKLSVSRLLGGVVSSYNQRQQK